MILLHTKGQFDLTDDITSMIDDAARLFDDAPDGDAAVLMSGGVDSSLAAAIASRARRAVGITMRHTDDDAPARNARAVCRELGIEHIEIEMRDTFDRLVATPFKEAYARGETPNPCAVCNRTVKFGALLEAAERGYGLVGPVVTGHYARTIRTPRGNEIARAIDRAKDQSYFLCTIPRSAARRLVLPLGSFTKEATRRALRAISPRGSELAAIADAPESMDNCFLSGDYRSFVGSSGRGGDIVSADGRVLAHHDGIEGFTIGQRKGLGSSSSKRSYVVAIDASTSTVVVATREEAFSRDVRARECVELLSGSVKVGARLDGRIRSQGAPSPCVVTRVSGDETEVRFDEPVFAPTPGQYLALYDGDSLALGGVIARHL